jgi:hypothetical protein
LLAPAAAVKRTVEQPNYLAELGKLVLIKAAAQGFADA